MSGSARRRRVGLAPLLLLAALPASARALDVEVTLGFDGVLVADAWAPLEVRCTLEPDDPPLRGRAVLELPRQAVGAFSAPLQVEPGGEGRALLAVAAGAGQTFEVRIEDESGRTIARASPSPLTTLLEGSERLVLLVGPEGLPAFRGADDLPRLAHLTPAEARPLSARLMSGLDAVFLRGGRSHAVRELVTDPAEVEGLARYAAGGGTVVLLAADGPFWQGTPLAPLVPLGGTLELSSAGTADLAPLLGALPEGFERVPFVSGRLRAGARALATTEDGAPLVASRPLGRGRVVVVAFDLDRPALRGAERLPHLLRQLTAPPGTPRFRLRSRELEETARDAFEATPPLGPPGFWLLAAAVAVHVLALGPLAAFAARRRGPWAGLLLPPIASLAVTTVLLAAGLAARGAPEARLLVTSFHGDEGEDLRTAWLHVDAGLFAGSSDHFRVTLPPGLAPTPQRRRELDLFQFRAPPATLAFEGGRPEAVERISLPARAATHLVLEGLAVEGLSPRGPVAESPPSAEAGPALLGPPLEVARRAGADPASAWPVLELTSRAPAPLDELYAVAVGASAVRVAALPPLAPGATTTWDAGQAAPPSLLELDPEASADPFVGGEAGRRAWVGRLVGLLEDERRRAEASAPSVGSAPFPDLWVVHLGEIAPPLEVATDAGLLERVRALRASLYPAGAR